MSSWGLCDWAQCNAQSNINAMDRWPSFVLFKTWEDLHPQQRQKRGNSGCQSRLLSCPGAWIACSLTDWSVQSGQTQHTIQESGKHPAETIEILIMNAEQSLDLYFEVTYICIMQGGVPGTKKRLITLRRSLFPQISRSALEEIKLKFIDTSSKLGHGRFQTSEEKAKILGKLKA